jgi:hypothetical protein
LSNPRITDLSPNQALFWNGQKLRPGSPIYNIPFVFDIQGRIYEESFRAAFRALVIGTDSLRAGIEEIDGSPIQRFIPGIPKELEILDLSDSVNPQAEAREWMAAQAAIPFNPEICVYTSALIKINRTEYIWFLNLYHVLADIWTVSILYHRMVKLYQCAREKTLIIVDKYPSLDQYLADQHEYTCSVEYQRVKAYWEQKLSGGDPILWESLSEKDRQKSKAVHKSGGEKNPKTERNKHPVTIFPG